MSFCGFMWNAAKKGEWTEIKIVLSAGADGFCGYYKDKYAGTQGIGDALSRTNGILNEGFDIMDKHNPINYIKNPIKKASKRVDTYISDGDPDKTTISERLWNCSKGIGDVADNLTTAKGLTYTSLCIAACGLVGNGLMSVLPEKGAVALGTGLNITGKTAGGCFIAKGAYDGITADSEADARNAGEKIGAGVTIFTLPAAKSKIPSLKIKKIPMPSANPNFSNLSTTYDELAAKK